MCPLVTSNYSYDIIIFITIAIGCRTSVYSIVQGVDDLYRSRSYVAILLYKGSTFEQKLKVASYIDF